MIWIVLFLLFVSSQLLADELVFPFSPLSHHYSRGEVVALQKDGKIVVAGTVNQKNKQDLFAARFDGAGNLDETFGDRGIRVMEQKGEEGVYGLDVHKNGNLVLGGYKRLGRNRHFMLVQLTPEGDLDSHFGEGGYVVDQRDGSSEIHFLKINRQEQIVAVGWREKSGNSNFVLARYTIKGEDEWLEIDRTKKDRFYGLTLQGDGKIVATGSLLDDSKKTNCVVARFNNRGEIDFSFGDQGFVVAGRESVCSAVDSDRQGRIWTTGYEVSARGDADFLVVRFDEEGRPDSLFGEAGIRTVDFEEGVDLSHALAFLPTGEALFFGESIQKHRATPSFLVLLKLGERGENRGAQKILFPEKAKQGEGAAMISDGQGEVIVTGHRGRQFFYEYFRR